jgi:transposase
MESTGVYWIPLFEVLAERGLEVQLVDPYYVQQVCRRSGWHPTASGRR